LGSGASLVLADLAVNALNVIKPSSGNVFTFDRRLSGLEILGLNSVHLDSRALLFTFGAALITGIIFGLAPALQGARADLSEGLTSSGARVSAPAGVLLGKNALVIGEVAMAMILITGGGLTIKSFALLIGTRSGIDPQNVLTVHIDVPGRGTPPLLSFSLSSKTAPRRFPGCSRPG
jgi:putative ABC transport system permease protein